MSEGIDMVAKKTQRDSLHFFSGYTRKLNTVQSFISRKTSIFENADQSLHSLVKQLMLSSVLSTTEKNDVLRHLKKPDFSLTRLSPRIFAGLVQGLEYHSTRQAEDYSDAPFPEDIALRLFIDAEVIAIYWMDSAAKLRWKKAVELAGQLGIDALEMQDILVTLDKSPPAGLSKITRVLMRGHPQLT